MTFQVSHMFFFPVASTEIPQPGHFNALWGEVGLFFFFLWIQQRVLT